MTPISTTINVGPQVKFTSGSLEIFAIRVPSGMCSIFWRVTTRSIRVKPGSLIASVEFIRPHTLEQVVLDTREGSRLVQTAEEAVGSCPSCHIEEVVDIGVSGNRGYREEGAIRNIRRETVCFQRSNGVVACLSHECVRYRDGTKDDHLTGELINAAPSSRIQPIMA